MNGASTVKLYIANDSKFQLLVAYIPLPDRESEVFSIFDSAKISWKNLTDQRQMKEVC